MEYDQRQKGWYSSCRDHEMGKPLIRNPTIGSREVSIKECLDFIKRSTQRL